MAAPLTTDQVIALAPDSASVAAGRKLAASRSWSDLGGDDRAVWGLAKGSGAKPYQVAVDVAGGPAFKCSCPSRKIPCKHVLGLLLLHAAGEFSSTEPPAYVSEWLQSRAQRIEAAATSREARAASAPDPQARAARAAKRASNIAHGLDELERFLGDLMREGLAAARERPAAWWDGQARRLVDAQAPGLAERVRRLGGTLHAGRSDWPARALEQAAMLYLVVRGWRREDLPADLRADLRAHVGWSLGSEAVRAASSPEPGPWAVIGVRVEAYERLRVRRTWLLREPDLSVGLLLDFAAPGGGTLPIGYPLGTRLDGDVHRYPGRSGLRMLAVDDLSSCGAWSGPSAAATIDAAVASWSRAVRADPLVDRIAVALSAVVPTRARDRWWVRDASGSAMPLPGDPWRLIALAGGRPVGVAGEWDGEMLRPLSAHSDGRVWSLT